MDANYGNLLRIDKAIPDEGGGLQKQNASSIFYTDVFISGVHTGTDSDPTQLIVQGYPINPSSSDERLKTNIEECKINALFEINSLQLVSFDWKEENGNTKILQKGHVRCGIIAQKAKQVNSNLADYNKKADTYQINLLNYTNILAKGIQEEDAKVEKLTKTVEKLQEENKKLKEILKTFADKLGLAEEINNILGN